MMGFSPLAAAPKSNSKSCMYIIYFYFLKMFGHVFFHLSFYIIALDYLECFLYI